MNSDGLMTLVGMVVGAVIIGVWAYCLAKVAKQEKERE
jgi:hypothetical protein